MTDNNHPITPPPELVQKLADGPGTWLEKIIKAYCAGADQELDACCERLTLLGCSGTAAEVRSFRRPKPPSLKEQALEVLKRLPIDPEAGYCPSELDTIRRALEILPD